MASIIDEFAYDVFLSFRGEDTRYGFTGNLKKALDDKGVCTFMDDEELQKGDEITPSLLKAIEDSKISIIVLSKNYASSSFCLQELSKIIDSMKDKADRSILPVFYKVDPSDVRKLKKTYGEAMDKHEASSSHNMNRWKASLQQVANLSGFHYKKGEMYEHEFIGKIVEEVLKKITVGITLHVGDYLVGLEPKKQCVISLLNIGSDDTVHMVGIHGIGGIGKTTLALEVYNSIIYQFQCSCFLKVRENYHKNGLELQKTLLSQIVEKNIDINSVEEGISILKKMLSKKKVLLLLDDVDNEKQLQDIAGNSNWFGNGSRVIITTRYRRLLTLHGVERTYEVKELNRKDAVELVKWNAFKNEKIGKDFSGYAHVLERAVAYASGLPLALEVIGSHFSNRTIEECKCAQDQCERVLDEKIQMTLQLSFDALKKEEKIVFLDIACCFKGYKLTTVEQVLHAHHGYSIKNHINVLVEKSLIKISESDKVTLHDLIEDMGKYIVRQESPNPGERSRLWASEDIHEVLEDNKGTSKIGILYVNDRIKVERDGKAFNRIENLKTLLIDEEGHFDGSLKHLPNSLRVLDCRSPYFIIDGLFLNKKFQNMRVLNLHHRTGVSLPIHDLSNLPNLEELSIENWWGVFRNDKSVCFLSNLKILRIINCLIRSVPPLDCPSLVELDLSYCGYLENFPLMVNGFVGNLKNLRLKMCSKIRIIPLHMLHSLEELNLNDCTSLESFSHVVGLGEKLKTMSIRSCYNLRSIPPLKLTSLEELDLTNCTSLQNFPLVVDEFLGKLKTLRVENCHKLKSIPPLKLDVLEKLYLSNCYMLESFPLVVGEFLGKLKTMRVKNCHNLKSIPPLKLDVLEELELSNCYMLESFLLVVGKFLGKLKSLRVENCQNLKSIPPLKLTSLEELDLTNCTSLQNFPLVVDEFLGKLKTLRVENCHKLKSIPPLKLDVLEKLYLSNCYMLESFPLVVGEFLGKLKTMRVKNCHNLKSIPPLKLDVLEELELSNCYMLESFLLVVGKFLGKLKSLRVENCQNLKSIPPLKLTSLEKLDLTNCTSLQNFPLVVDAYLGKLKILHVENCHNLKSIPPLKLDVLEKLDLSNCFMLESFPLVVGEFLGKLKTMRVKRCYNIKSIPPLKLDSLEILDLSDCTSLESFSVGVDEYLLKLETLLAPNCHNLRSMPLLKLDSLKELDLSCCYSLESFQSAGNGLLENIKFFNIEKCILLKSIPPLSVTSLKKFNISHCLSLESFPEISGEMRNIPTLHLDNIPKKLLPLPLQNLTPAQTLYPCNCGIVEFPNRAAEVSSMLAESTIEGEGYVRPMKYSHVEYICLYNIKLSDEYWSISFMLFANMKELHLAKNQFTVLPKSMEKCKFLWRLVLDDCVKLKEIKGIPPCLRVLSALNCQSLTSSSKSKLLNQKLHEVGNTCFRIPRANVPAWFDHQWSTGLPIPFWFRNKFPTIILCVYSPSTWDSILRPKVIINGNTFSITHGLNMSRGTKSDTNHLNLFHMQLENFNDKMDNALLQNKWNHAEVHFGISFFFSGIHVLKDKSRMEDIQFTNPDIE